MPGFAIASPDAASAEARPVFLREVDLPDADDKVGPDVAEVGTGGIGVPWFDPRRQGRRFVPLPVDLIETASELSGTLSVDPKLVVVRLTDMGCGSVISGVSPVGDSTSVLPSECAGGEGGYGADVERSWREDVWEDWGESREGSMILSLLRRLLFDDV